MTSEQSTSDASDLTDLINRFSKEFDDLTHARHVAGAEKYGPIKFMAANTLEEACEEILDLANYARYTYIKIRLLALSLSEMTEDIREEEVVGFIKTGEGEWNIK